MLFFPLLIQTCEFDFGVPTCCWILLSQTAIAFLFVVWCPENSAPWPAVWGPDDVARPIRELHSTGSRSAADPADRCQLSEGLPMLRLPFFSRWEWPWIFRRSCLLCSLWGCLLCPRACSLLPGILTLCPGWNVTGYLNGFFFGKALWTSVGQLEADIKSLLGTFS